MWSNKHIFRFSLYLLFVTVTLAPLLSGCIRTYQPWQTTSEFVPGGSPRQGWETLQAHGCQSCHLIPGIPAPHTYVGPPLNRWPDRSYIAGRLENNPENLIYWLRFPQEVEPGTAMPDLGLTEAEARDISAYLYTLNR